MVNGLRITPATQAAQHPSGFHAPSPQTRSFTGPAPKLPLLLCFDIRVFIVLYLLYTTSGHVVYVMYISLLAFQEKSTREFQTMILRV